MVVIAGDGGFQLNIQELLNDRAKQLPLKIIVLNNECHGMVRQFRGLVLQRRLQSTVWGYSAPAFASVARKLMASKAGESSRLMKSLMRLEARMKDSRKAISS